MFRSPVYFAAAAAILIFTAFAGVDLVPGASDRGDPSSDEQAADVRPTESLHDSLATAGVSSRTGGRTLSRRNIYGAEDVDFAVQFQNHVIPYSVFGVYVMPGEEVDIRTVLARSSGPYEVEASAGTVSTLGQSEWQWTAPEKTGVSTIQIRNTITRSKVTLNAFVLTPFTVESRELNGYRIGKYEEVMLDGDPTYRPPAGFIELRPDIRDVKVSPHFTLGQFVAKQESSYPKYLLLREPLLLKLEMLLSEVNKLGAGASSLYIMSGYRTPHYNRAIGNTTNYSRHLYGGAADVFVDVDEDGYMDDLTGEGRVDIDDAQLLAGIIEDNTGKEWYTPFTGGLGVYAKNSVRGPFIHLDVRGHRARW